MGLDNGIILHCDYLTTKGDRIEDVLKKFRINFPYGDKGTVLPDNTFKVEVIYFRKFYSFRDEVNYILANTYDDSTQTAKIYLKELREIKRKLEFYLDEDYFDANASTIWEYDDMVENIRDAVKNMQFLINNWYHIRIKELIWYDSY